MCVWGGGDLMNVNNDNDYDGVGKGTWDAKTNKHR